jgi:hypothetical protein
MMNTETADSRSFFDMLLGDGRSLVILMAMALLFSGGGALFLATTGHFLPHDVDFLGMEPTALCGLNQCRIVHFMIHDRASFGGVMLAMGVIYLWLALFPLKEGRTWAWWTIAVTNAAGFGSFLAYLGYGYLDSWHAWATLMLLPVAIAGLWLTRRLCTEPLDLVPAWLPGQPATAPWLSRQGLAWLLWMAWGGGLVASGAVILLIGMTQVFVPSDLAYIGYTLEQLNGINPRLVPLIAHDRAGFGGGVLTTGLLLLCVLWKAPPSKHRWQAVTLAGSVGFACAVGVHYPIGYLAIEHLLPAWLGTLVFGLGAWMSRKEWAS